MLQPVLAAFFQWPSATFPAMAGQPEVTREFYAYELEQRATVLDKGGLWLQYMADFHSSSANAVQVVHDSRSFGVFVANAYTDESTQRFRVTLATTTPSDLDVVGGPPVELVVGPNAKGICRSLPQNPIPWHVVDAIGGDPRALSDINDPLVIFLQNALRPAVLRNISRAALDRHGPQQSFDPVELKLLHDFLKELVDNYARIPVSAGQRAPPKHWMSRRLLDYRAWEAAGRPADQESVWKYSYAVWYNAHTDMINLQNYWYYYKKRQAHKVGIKVEVKSPDSLDGVAAGGSARIVSVRSWNPSGQNRGDPPSIGQFDAGFAGAENEDHFGKHEDGATHFANPQYERMFDVAFEVIAAIARNSEKQSVGAPYGPNCLGGVDGRELGPSGTGLHMRVDFRYRKRSIDQVLGMFTQLMREGPRRGRETPKFEASGTSFVPAAVKEVLYPGAEQVCGVALVLCVTSDHSEELHQLCWRRGRRVQ